MDEPVFTPIRRLRRFSSAADYDASQTVVSQELGEFSVSLGPDSVEVGIGCGFQPHYQLRRRGLHDLEQTRSRAADPAAS